MSKLVTTDIENINGAPIQAALAINENNARIEEAVEKTLSRDGTAPNQMEAQLDMNGNRIINLGAPVQLDDAIRLRDALNGVTTLEGTNPAGGTDGQVLTKQSAADYDYAWENIPGPTGVVLTVEPGVGIDVDATIPTHPVVAVEAAVISGAAAGATAVQPARTLTAGAGLTGGGDLSANRTFDVGAGTGITVNANDVALNAAAQAADALANSAVQPARTLTAGAGLTGGGDLSANRTFDVGAGTGITVNANDIAITNTAVTPGSYTSANITVNAQGQITAASNGSGSGGSMVFVVEVSVAGAAATNITISGLDIGTDECYYMQLALAGAAAGAATLNIFFNGDTTATNYERDLVSGGADATGDNSAFGGLSNGDPGLWVGWLRRCPVTGRIMFIHHGGRINGAVGLNYGGMVIWDTSANLTSFTINSSVASQIAIGSMVRVWKIAS